MASNSWVFTQLAGSRTEITLDGYNAPFGRPRQKPVAKEVIKSQVQTTYYPGQTNRPTRHSFGIRWEPIELTGRWMTKMQVGGRSANDIADAWRVIIREESPCRISWGNIVSYIGYIEELELGRESEHEIAWKMKVLIDARDDEERGSIADIGSNSIPSTLEFINDSLGPLHLKNPGDLANAIAGLSSEFTDAFDNLVRDLNGPSATLAKLKGTLNDFGKATYSDIQHLRSASKQFKDTMFDIVDLVYVASDPTPAGGLARFTRIVRTAKDDIDWVKYQLLLDTQSSELAARLAELDRQAELQQRQEAKFAITAKSTHSPFVAESWESLAIRATGDPNQASRIRELNGGGTRPIVGEDYLY